MAYTSSTLDYIFGSTIEGTFKMWSYRTSDVINQVLAANYISDVTSVTSGGSPGLPTGNKRGMSVGDLVFVINQGVPFAELTQVASIGASGASLQSADISTVTDASGGVANATTGIIATLASQTVLFYTTLAGLANSQVLNYVPSNGGKVTAASFTVKVAATTAAKAATLTAQINGTNVTSGGVIALTSANCTPSGNVTLSTAIVPQAIPAPGSTVGFNVSAVTAFVEGDGYAALTLVNTDLANAIATMLRFG